MKKVLLSLILSTSSFVAAFSQNYHVLEWDVLGISRLTPGGDMESAVGMYSEVRFNLSDRISLGLRHDWQFFNRIHDEPTRGLGISTAYAITGDYYVYNVHNTRAFAGLAIGSFNNTATTEGGEDIGGSGLGMVPRIGFKLPYFLRLTVKYNYTFKDDFPNYFAMGVGLNIGGRHKGSK